MRSVALIILFTLFVGACTTSRPDREEYFEALAPHLDPATAAREEWTAFQERPPLDSSGLPSAEARAFDEQQLKLALNVLETSREALTGLRLVDPPPECRDRHVLVMESLQLTEQAMTYLVRWTERFLRAGQDDRDLMARGNELVAESDRVSQRALFAAEGCQ